MAKLPGYRRIFTQDYDKQYQALIDKLSVSVNQGFDSLYQALNNGLTLEDNSTSTIVTISVTTDANGNVTSGAQFNLSSTTKIIGTQVISAINNTNSKVYVTSQPFITFTQNGGTVTINNITGLPAGNNFSLTIITYT